MKVQIPYYKEKGKPNKMEEIFGPLFTDLFSFMPEVETKSSKGIAEDAFRNALQEELMKRGRTPLTMQSVASDYKDQHEAHKKNHEANKSIKKSQDHKMTQKDALAATRRKLANLGPRPADSKKAKTWTKRRHSLAEKISKQVQAMRTTDTRVANLRASK